MRTLMTVVASLAAACVAAVAADMPPPRPAPVFAPPVVDTPTWTGLYIGINGGGGFGNADSDFSAGGGATFASVDLP